MNLIYQRQPVLMICHCLWRKGHFLVFPITFLKKKIPYVFAITLNEIIHDTVKGTLVRNTIQSHTNNNQSTVLGSKSQLLDGIAFQPYTRVWHLNCAKHGRVTGAPRREPTVSEEWVEERH